MNPSRELDAHLKQLDMKLKLIPNQCTWHLTVQRLYLQSHLDAEKKIQSGQFQIQCSQCKLWFWENEFGKPKEEK